MTSSKILPVDNVVSDPPGNHPAPTVGSATQQAVLVVDLDETLIRTDTLHEQFVRLFFSAPAQMLDVLPLMFSKPRFKAALAERITLDPAILPLQDDVVSFIKAERAKGTRIVLCTAANESVARSVADHLDLFDEVIASDANTNMKGPEKAARLTALFPGGFSYIGDSAADLDVWRVAQSALLVDASAYVRQRVRSMGKPILAEFSSRNASRSRAYIWAKALRVHHWSKNLLIFIPLLLGHLWLDGTAILTTSLGFLLLLAVTSSSYLINDLADIDADRRHFTKRSRPLAQGSLSIRSAVLAAGITLPVAIVGAFWMSRPFGFALSAYLVITLVYSFRLKRIPLLDLFVIANLFTSRLLMGMTVIDTPISRWLLIFSLFFFFSLATAKRHVEIIRAKDFGAASLKTRGYEVDDAPLTLALGVAAGLGCLIIMVLYLIEEAFVSVSYTNPTFLWAVPMVLAVWIGRIWILCHRGVLSDDPVSFALRDRVSLYLGALVAAAFALAL